MDLYISPQEKLDLKRLLKTSDCDNNTEHIRKVKHSAKIQKDIMELVTFKKQNNKLYDTNPERFEQEARGVAEFLYATYPDIFRKVINNEINYEIMVRLLYILKAIEDEKVDQHEGSVLVGKELKALYLDSAIRHGDNLDKKYKKCASSEIEALEDDTTDSSPPPVVEKLISWKQYKMEIHNT